METNEPLEPLPGVPKPVTVIVDGRKWSLFSAQYRTDEGLFEFEFYAISEEHARHIIDDIKETATFAGQVLGVYKA